MRLASPLTRFVCKSLFIRSLFFDCTNPARHGASKLIPPKRLGSVPRPRTELSRRFATGGQTTDDSPPLPGTTEGLHLHPQTHPAESAFNSLKLRNARKSSVCDEERFKGCASRQRMTTPWQAGGHGMPCPYIGETNPAHLEACSDGPVALLLEDDSFSHLRVFRVFRSCLLRAITPHPKRPKVAHHSPLCVLCG